MRASPRKHRRLGAPEAKPVTAAVMNYAAPNCILWFGAVFLCRFSGIRGN